MFKLIALLVISVISVSASPGVQRSESKLRSDCAKFVKSLDQPMHATARQLSGDELGGKPDGANFEGRPTYQIGQLRYFGAGVEATSTDRRFSKVRVFADQGAMHDCGYRVNFWPGPWNMLLGDVSSAAFRFERGRVTKPRTGTPGKAPASGPSPVITNFVSGARWPLSKSDGTIDFVQLMHPKNGSSETLIVRLDNSRSTVRTSILGKLPVRFQAIGLVPNLHSSGRMMNLVGKDPNGPYHSIVLQMPDGV